MRTLTFLAITPLLILAACGGPDTGTWTSEFSVDKEDLVSSGRNVYFVLEPGNYLVLEGDGVQLTVSVLDEKEMIDGVETRVVEERETEDGQLVEVSRNYFALNKRTNDVFYFGEDVDIYEDGRVVSHEGAWRSGIQGARFGLIMPGQVNIEARYYQEVAPGVAQDRARHVSLGEKVKTPAGEFRDCLKVEETTPLEPGAKEYKYYAPGVGLIRDGELRLVRYGHR